MQSTSHILMIRPTQFAFNEATAVNNHFQVRSGDTAVQEKAAAEFASLVNVLRSNGIDVTVIDDTPEPHTPDSVFPNNWISFHNDGMVLLYPMFAENRRLERKEHVLETIREKFKVSEIADLSYYESEEHFLEGTGSMVLDRENRIAYACLSPRTDKAILDVFCARMNYRPVVFHAMDARDQAIYHTNVMMCVADRYVVICADSIRNEDEKEAVLETIRATGKEIVTINHDQVDHFAGNMLQVHNAQNETFLVMSAQAYHSLQPAQLETLQSYNELLYADIHTIEANGGGSARCMMAEVFLPIK